MALGADPGRRGELTWIGPWAGRQFGLSADHPLTYSEFGTFLKKSVSNSYFSEIKTRMNELFDCGPIGRRKANGKGVHVEYPRASFLGACAREYLENYTESVDWTAGIMWRLVDLCDLSFGRANAVRYVRLAVCNRL